MSKADEKFINTFDVTLPSEIVIPTPFGIYPPKSTPSEYAQALKLRYGNHIMKLYGRILTVKDHDVFIALNQLKDKKGSFQFKTTVKEICKILGRQYVKSSKKSIEDSILHLFGAKIKITNTKRKGDWIAVSIVSGAASIAGEISVNLNETFNTLYEKGKELTYLDAQFRLGLKGFIARNLYVYYQRQVSAGCRKEYLIAFNKLCSYIGLDRDGKTPLFEKRHQMKKGHQELIDRKYLESYTVDENDIIIVNLTDEWIDKIRKRKKQHKQIEIKSKPEPFFEGKPTSKGGSIPSEKLLKYECPYGAVFGIDCNKIDQCQECEEELWSTCKNKQDELKPKVKTEPKIIPEKKPVIRHRTNLRKG